MKIDFRSLLKPGDFQLTILFVVIILVLGMFFFPLNLDANIEPEIKGTQVLNLTEKWASLSGKYVYLAVISEAVSGAFADENVSSMLGFDASQNEYFAIRNNTAIGFHTEYEVLPGQHCLHVKERMLNETFDYCMAYDFPESGNYPLLFINPVLHRNAGNLVAIYSIEYGGRKLQYQDNVSTATSYFIGGRKVLVISAPGLVAVVDSETGLPLAQRLEIGSLSAESYLLETDDRRFEEFLRNSEVSAAAIYEQFGIKVSSAART